MVDMSFCMSCYDCHNDTVAVLCEAVRVCPTYILTLYCGLMLCFNLKETVLVTIEMRHKFNSEITLKNSVYYNLKV